MNQKKHRPNKKAPRIGHPYVVITKSEIVNRGKIEVNIGDLTMGSHRIEPNQFPLNELMGPVWSTPSKKQSKKMMKKDSVYQSASINSGQRRKRVRRPRIETEPELVFSSVDNSECAKTTNTNDQNKTILKIILGLTMIGANTLLTNYLIQKEA